MMYQLMTTDKFDKAFKKLDNHTQKIIKAWIDKNLIDCENPRIHGKELGGMYRSESQRQGTDGKQKRTMEI